MRIFAGFLLVIFSFSPVVIAYPQEQLNDCISSAQKNPSIEGASKSSIENYCNCALQLIVDEGKELRESGYQCALKNFGWLFKSSIQHLLLVENYLY